MLMPHSKGVNCKRMHLKYLWNLFDIKHLKILSDNRQFLSFFYLLKNFLEVCNPRSTFHLCTAYSSSFHMMVYYIDLT